MSMQLVSTITSHTPLQFADSAGCKAWIEQLTLTNVALTQQVLTTQLASLGVAQLTALERLKILEAFREPVQFVQDESAKRYSGKGLPLEPNELTAWSNEIALWQEMGQNYQLCLNAYREGDLAIAPHAALVTMRCLHLIGHTMMEYYRTYREPPGAMWQALHELYSFAEQHGYARIRIHDSFAQREPDSSCAESYVHVLLTHLANPFSLSVRQLGFVERWLERWATLVGLAVQPPPSSSFPLLGVDLNGARPAEFADGLQTQPGLRYFELEQLSKTLRQTINLLKQGQTPGSLGLGDDAQQPGCENLLMLLYVQWCRAGATRTEERAGSEEPAQVCFGLAAAHNHLSGGRSTRPSGELTSRDKQDLDNYGYIMRVSHEVKVNEPEPESETEPWQILNQSASGFMCMRRVAGSKTRIHHNQMLVVRRTGSRHPHLGMVQWLKIEEGGEHVQCGVRLFPGIPQAISVRPSNFNPVGGGRYERALLLPEVAAPSAPASLVLPAGWFQGGRFVEIFSDRKQVAKLLNLLEKGSDFDRGTIVIV